MFNQQTRGPDAPAVQAAAIHIRGLEGLGIRVAYAQASVGGCPN